MQTPETTKLYLTPTSTHLDLTPLHDHHILEPPGGFFIFVIEKKRAGLLAGFQAGLPLGEGAGMPLAFRETLAGAPLRSEGTVG